MKKITNTTITMSLTFCLAFIVFLGGCNDSTVNTTEETSKGSIVGMVTLMNQWGKPIEPYYKNWDGVRVSLEGTEYTAVTDSAGRYELKNVLPGAYTIRFEKEGYGTMKIIGYNFAGSGQSVIKKRTSVSQIPRYIAVIDSVENIPSTKLFGHISEQIPLGGKGGVVVYVGTTPDISYKDPTTYKYYSALSLLNFSRHAERFVFPFGKYASSRLEAGEKYYAKIYPMGLGSYIDIETGYPIFPNVGAPTTFEFTYFESVAPSKAVNSVNVQGTIIIGDKTITVPRKVSPQEWNAIQKKVNMYIKNFANK